MAEIRQKIISCSQGHYYDANRYDSCPYCNSGSFSPTVDPFAHQAQGVSPTVGLEWAGAPLGQNYGGFSPFVRLGKAGKPLSGLRKLSASLALL